MMKFILIVFATVFIAPAQARPPALVKGKIFVRNGQTFISQGPDQGLPEYKIRWLQGFKADAVCYYQRDKLCPEYVVYFRSMQRSVLIDAVTDIRFGAEWPK
jgi:hypothetical protein